MLQTWRRSSRGSERYCENLLSFSLGRPATKIFFGGGLEIPAVTYQAPPGNEISEPSWLEASLMVLIEALTDMAGTET